MGYSDPPSPIEVSKRDTNILPMWHTQAFDSFICSGRWGLNISGCYWDGEFETMWEGLWGILTSCLEIMVKRGFKTLKDNPILLWHCGSKRRAFKGFVLCLKTSPPPPQTHSHPSSKNIIIMSPPNLKWRKPCNNELLLSNLSSLDFA